MNSLEMSVSNMDFVHALFSEIRYPHPPPPLWFAVREEKHAVLLLLALLMQWMSTEAPVTDQACRTLGSCMLPVPFYCVCHLNHLPASAKPNF